MITCKHCRQGLVTLLRHHSGEYFHVACENCRQPADEREEETFFEERRHANAAAAEDAGRL